MKTDRRDSAPKVSPGALHGDLQSTSTPPDWDEIMRRVHIPAVYPLNHISLAVSRCFPTPTQASTGQRSIMPRYMHCIMGTQMMITLTFPQSIQTPGAMVVVPPFQPGHVYQWEDLGLNPLHPWHAQPPAVPMLWMSILSLVDLQTGDLAVATPLYCLMKEVLFMLEIVTEGNQQQTMWDFPHWVERAGVERWVMWAVNFQSQNYQNPKYH